MERQEESSECRGVHCTPEQLMEIQGTRVVLAVLARDVKTIALRYGIRSPHPVLQIIAGIFFLGLGYFPAMRLIDWIEHGGTIFGPELWLLSLAALGIWLILTALRRGYFLDVTTPGDPKRFVFKGRPGSDELKAFVAAVEACYGVEVAREDWTNWG